MIKEGVKIRHFQEYDAFKTVTINIRTIIESIDSTNDGEMQNDVGLYLYLYVMYSNYSKTWIEKIVKDNTTGNIST